jgi:PAT family beta-lactamase induction signal transducer AmpG
MLYLFLMGLSSGLPLALTWGTLQAWMTDVHVDLKTIGLFAFLRLPFSLKFLWSPFMDRYQLPFLDRRRGWVVLMQLLLALTFIGVSLVDPGVNTVALMILALLCNFFAASQDIVLDAYRRDILSDSELGMGSGVFVNGYLIAFRFISGAGAIFLSSYIPWTSVYQIMALLMILFMVPVFRAPSSDSTEKIEAPQSLNAAYLEPLKEYFSRPGAITIISFIILYKMGDNIAMNMTIPFILQNGFSKAEYAAIAKVWGLGANLFGGLLGGMAVHYLGIIRSLMAMGILQAISNASFIVLADAGHNIPLLMLVIGFENLAVGMGTSASAAFMASVTNRKFSATQYALLSSLMAIPGIVFASQAGAMADLLGWPAFFLTCGLLSLPGLFLVPFLYKEPEAPSLILLKKILVAATVLAGGIALAKSSGELARLFIK